MAKQRKGSAAPVKARPAMGPWIVVAGVVAVVAILAVVKLSEPSPAPTGAARDGQAVSSQMLAALRVPRAVLAGVGKGGAAFPSGAGIRPQAAALTSGGKPEMLYIGGDFCPYCAAERWALVVALSRFGSFSSLRYMTSSASDVYPSTPTFTFYKAAYSSPYLTFVGVETAGNRMVGGQYQPLQSPTAGQQALLKQYDPNGSIPFLDLGGRFVQVGANYDPGVLKGLGWRQIAAQAREGKGSVGQDILGSANVLTAAICATDGQRPAQVCKASYVQNLEAALPRG
ncbi:MAG: DUF929 family protein [Thermaerobacter sp.]|nr:DUF929 family protein [Thermaerobacter sp.]